jgi:hypothetical protein
VINERAIAMIRSTVSLNCAHLIGDSQSSAMNAWNNLESAFASKLKARMAAIKAELQGAKLGKRSIGDFIGAIVRLSTELKAAGGTFTDEEQHAAILAGLPESYQSVVDVLSEQALSTSELQAKLQLAEGRRQKAARTPAPTSNPGHAHAAHGAQTPAKQRMSSADYKAWVAKQKCRHCGNKGHLWKSCARRLREESKTGAVGGIALGNAFSALAM